MKNRVIAMKKQSVCVAISLTYMKRILFYLRRLPRQLRWLAFDGVFFFLTVTSSVIATQKRINYIFNCLLSRFYFV